MSVTIKVPDNNSPPRELYGGTTKPALRPLSKDRLAMLPRGTAARAAHQALNGLQREPPEVMVAGAALLFAAIVNRCGLDPQEMHHLGLRMMRDQEAHKLDNDSLQSLRDFAGIRIMGEKHVSIA